MIAVPLKNNYLIVLSSLSFIRVVLYLYWIYWFNTFILPVIFIAEIGLFLATQMPAILAIVDSILTLGFLISKGRNWSLLMIGSAVSIAFSIVYLSSFSPILSISIMLVSALQGVVLSTARTSKTTL